ncbi:transcriptional regulator [Saccharomonospora xinjiangensis XJ-54]|uniref:Transcriptional regulator n=1 Tax=Saccharomonospora xinjiangensis XJ-54 TaxID=882086 RepID=I0V1L7_9PSEU|nr:transcriptional regulator [Saccharomonospora xinjiangensis XJ-54]
MRTLRGVDDKLPGSRRAGRGPRQAQAIYQVTLELLAEGGYDGVTIEGVAARSGVNKTTIYRWWADKDALLGAAIIQSSLLRFEVPDTGSLRGDLRVLVRRVVRLLTEDSTSRVVAAALSAVAGRPRLAWLAREFFADRLSGERAVFGRAAERGELSDSVDPALVLDLLAGAVWSRVILRQMPVTGEFADQVVDVVLEGCGARS